MRLLKFKRNRCRRKSVTEALGTAPAAAKKLPSPASSTYRGTGSNSHKQRKRMASQDDQNGKTVKKLK